MKITIAGKDIKATEAIKAYVEKKMERIAKYFDEELNVEVTIKTEKNEQIAEIFTKVNAMKFRAVTSHKDLYASIDRDVDILEGQVRKVKTIKEANKKGTSKSIKQQLIRERFQVEDEIIKTIYYDIKPITVEDAKLKLQDKPRDRFITFINVDTNKVNVLFKLKDNKNFGLLEPEG